MIFLNNNCPSHGKIDHLEELALLQPTDQGIIEAGLFCSAWSQRIHDARYNVAFLGAIHFLNVSWTVQLASSKVASCFRTVVSDRDDDQPDDDQNCSDPYDAVRKIASQESKVTSRRLRWWTLPLPWSHQRHCW